jgi:hypothetical protein
VRPLEQDLGWNKKKILFFVVLTLCVLIAALAYLAKNETQVKGANTFIPAKGDTFDAKSNELSKGVREKVLGIQDDVKSLDVTEVATSTPQIQKIIKDIQSIQDLPASKAKEACQKVCDGL